MKNIICILMLMISLSLSSMSEAKEIQKQNEIQRHSIIPKEVFYDYISDLNPNISMSKIKDIYRAVEYYMPRYFGEDGVFEEGLVYVLAMISQESTFYNKNGDEGLSIGYMMIQIKTCNGARKYNGIKRQMNLISRWDNIHCGMAEFNRLTEHYDHNWEDSVRAYNAGINGVKFWKRWKGKDISHLSKKTQENWTLLNFQTERHWGHVSKYRDKILKRIEEYKNSK